MMHVVNGLQATTLKLNPDFLLFQLYYGHITNTSDKITN